MDERTIPPFSLRLTFEERAKLERDAAGMALGAYIRSRLLDPETVAPRKRGKFPVKDHQALAQLLGADAIALLYQFGHVQHVHWAQKPIAPRQWGQALWRNRTQQHSGL